MKYNYVTFTKSNNREPKGVRMVLLLSIAPGSLISSQKDEHWLNNIILLKIIPDPTLTPLYEYQALHRTRLHECIKFRERAYNKNANVKGPVDPTGHIDLARMDQEPSAPNGEMTTEVKPLGDQLCPSDSFLFLRNFDHP